MRYWSKCLICYFQQLFVKDSIVYIWQIRGTKRSSSWNLSVAEPGFENLSSKASVLSFCSMLLLICDAAGGVSPSLPVCLPLSLTLFSKTDLCTWQPLTDPHITVNFFSQERKLMKRMQNSAEPPSPTTLVHVFRYKWLRAYH